MDIKKIQYNDHDCNFENLQENLSSYESQNALNEALNYFLGYNNTTRNEKKARTILRVIWEKWKYLPALALSFEISFHYNQHYQATAGKQYILCTDIFIQSSDNTIPSDLKKQMQLVWSEGMYRNDRIMQFIIGRYLLRSCKNLYVDTPTRAEGIELVESSAAQGFSIAQTYIARLLLLPGRWGIANKVQKEDKERSTSLFRKAMYQNDMTAYEYYIDYFKNISAIDRIKCQNIIARNQGDNIPNQIYTSKVITSLRLEQEISIIENGWENDRKFVLRTYLDNYNIPKCLISIILGY